MYIHIYIYIYIYSYIHIYIFIYRRVGTEVTFGYSSANAFHPRCRRLFASSGTRHHGVANLEKTIMTIESSQRDHEDD